MLFRNKFKQALRESELEALYEDAIQKAVCDDEHDVIYYSGVACGLGRTLGIPRLLTRWRIDDLLVLRGNGKTCLK